MPISAPMPRSSLRLQSLSLVVLLAAGAAVAADDPQSWLTRMEQALATTNYQGVFVHAQSGRAETLRIVHRVQAGEIAERIWSMDGSGREFIRRGHELQSYLPDQRLVLVEQNPEPGLLLAELRRLDAAASGQYRVAELTRTRVSGREARVIAVEPLDEYRYGYRLWIDEASAMPLKSQLRSSRGHVIEQIVFTELTLPRQIADSALSPQVDARNFRWLRHTGPDSGAVSDDTSLADWQARELPPGFRMTARSMQSLPGGGRPVPHLVFSDGLASVSVFVEESSRHPANAAQSPAVTTGDPSSGVTHVGSSSAFSTEVQGHRVTAIGEVPPDTVRAIARSMLATPGRGARGPNSAADTTSPPAPAAPPPAGGMAGRR